MKYFLDFSDWRYNSKNKYVLLWQISDVALLQNMQKLNFTTFLNKICRELRKIRETDWFSCKNHETKKKKSLKLFWVGGLLSGFAQNMQSVNFGDQNWFAQWKREVSIKQEEVKRVKGDAGQGNMKFRHYIT